MQTSATRPAVDVGPRSSRPGLALALGILSVPGSTIAFDLPGGGFWIGLPLGVAAIVLGIRARRDHNRSRMATVGIVLAVLSIGQMAVWTTVDAFSSSDDKASAPAAATAAPQRSSTDCVAYDGPSMVGNECAGAPGQRP